MRKNSLYLFALLLLIPVSGLTQEARKVAVFDPVGTVDMVLLEIVREEISTVVVNKQGFTVLERQLINKVLEENRFQESGLVNDDEQVSNIGSLMGADFVVVSTVSSLGANYYISCKLIEVATARIYRQNTGMTKNGTADLTAVIQDLAGTMFVQPDKSVSELLQAPLQAKGLGVYAGNKKLSAEQIRFLMANTTSLAVYNAGKSKQKNGNGLIIGGIIVTAGSFAFGSLIKYTEYTHEGDDIIGRRYNYMGEAGLVGGVIGGGMAILGITMQIKGKKHIQQSVEMYNSQKQPATEKNLSLELKPDGIGLVFNF